MKNGSMVGSVKEASCGHYTVKYVHDEII